MGGRLIINEIIETVRNTNSYSFVVYFSDHEEEVYDCRNAAMHTETNGTKNMFDIPFIVWLSDEYISHNQEKIMTMRKNVDVSYLNDDFMHSICDLAGISFNLFHREKSIFSSSFISKKRFIGKIPYDDFQK